MAILHALCRLESTFEPIFAELALYDAKERKKVSIFLYAAKLLRYVENFHGYKLKPLEKLCIGPVMYVYAGN